MVRSAVSSVSTPGVLVTVMPAGVGGGDVDVVDAGAEVGDQLQLLAGRGDDAGVDAVGDGRHQHVGARHRRGQARRRQRRVVEIELGVEQLAHPRLHRIGEFAACHDDFRLADGHGATSSKGARDRGQARRQCGQATSDVACEPRSSSCARPWRLRADAAARAQTARPASSSRRPPATACRAGSRLKRGEVFGRKGPGKDYPTVFVYHARGPAGAGGGRDHRVAEGSAIRTAARSGWRAPWSTAAAR